MTGLAIGARPGARPGARLVVPAALALVLAAVVARAPGLLVRTAVNPDESTVGTIGRVMEAGGRLYVDVVDRKPPLLPLVYWVLERVSGGVGDLRLARLVALASVVATCWLLAREARRRYGLEQPTALLAAVGVMAFTVLPARDTQSTTFEALAVLPATLGFVLAARGRTTAGALATAVATLAKQTFVLGLVPVLYLAHRRHGWAGVARALAAYLLTVGAAAPFFGGRPFFYWSFLEAAGYASDGGALVRAGVALVAMLVVLGAMLAGPLLLARPVLRLREPELLLWLAGGLVAYVAGLRFLTHYAFQLLPPLTLAALGGLRAAGPRRTAGLALTALVSATWLAVGFVNTTAPDRYHDVGRYVAERTQPGDRIFVWGQSSQVYWEADRLPASRFPHIQFLTGLTPRPGDDGEHQPDYVTTAPSWQDLWADFADHAPVLIVDTTGLDGASVANAVLGRSPLGPYVRSGYRLAGTVDGVVVWKRVTPLTG